MSTESLAGKSCVPCRGGVPPLEPAEARKYASEVPEWKLDAGGRRISRQFEFAGFAEAMRFVNRVAELAEEQGHHPDFGIHWNKVDLTLYTHKIDGLHENDFVMAARIDRLLR